MPWNDNSNTGGKPGPKSGGKPGPWGAPPSGGGGNNNGAGGGPKGPGRPTGKRPPPADLNDIGRQLSRRLGDLFGRGGGGGVKPGAIAVGAGALVAVWALTGVYIVQSDEEAVVTTFGAYTGWNGPGLHYHLPAPIQRVQKVSVTAVRRTEIGGQAGADQPEESLMLTSDENIIDLDFTVQWKVSDASDFIFNLEDPEGAVKAVAESAMREVVGKTLLQPLLTTARGQVQNETLDLMQRTLDRYRAGVTIDEVLIRNAGPPPQVVAAFREVTTAEQEAESVQNVARGVASQIEQAARAYALQAKLEAEGEAARFNQLYAQYKLAPAVTRDRLYIETMQRVLARSNKVVIDSEGASAPVILPPDVFRPRSQPTAPVTTSELKAGTSQ